MRRQYFVVYAIRLAPGQFRHCREWFDSAAAADAFYAAIRPVAASIGRPTLTDRR